MAKQLTLCVPTYNRSNLLEQALQAILSQIDSACAAKIEVLVMDNASPDNTPQVIAKAKTDFPEAPLRSLRQTENVGPDANYLEATRLAQGEFVYLLSDDDLLLPGAVIKILSLIQEHPKLDAFCLNVRPFLHDIAEVTQPTFILEADRLIQGRDAALLFLGTHITFMSSIVFRRQNVIGHDYRDKFASNLAQAHMFVDALSPGNGMYVTRQPFLAQRMDNTGPFDFFKVFVTNFHALMQYAEQAGYSAQSIRQVQFQHLRFVKNMALKLLISGSGGIRSDYRGTPGRLLKVYGMNAYMLLCVMPLILFPQSLAKPMFRAYRQLKHRR